MDDSKIIELFFARNQEAIQQTDKVYGRRLFLLADRIVRNEQDAEESVSDTYMKAWENIPPTRPTFFYAYLAKICRFLSMGKLDWNNAAKRKAEVVELSAEMETCIPDVSREMQVQSQELGALINEFLGTLSDENRRIFMRRYWHGESIGEIAQRFHLGESNVKTKLMRTRNALRIFLEKEGIKP